jgi:uncharacterized membrane protein YccC
VAGETPVAGWLRAGRRIVSAELRRGNWLSFGQFRWQDMDLPAALRAGAGMITPLAVGIATGHAEYGVFASLGSLPAGFVSFQGVSRTRVTAILLAAVAIAFATFAGGTAAHADAWLLVPAVLAVSYPSGLLVALGPRLSIVGLQAIVQLVIASDVPLPPREAAIRAAFAFAGGLWQGVLVVASWTVMRGGRERAALAASYRELSRYAAELAQAAADGRHAPPQPAAFPGSAVLSDPNPLLRAPARFRMLQLLEQAERIRASLAALALYTPRCDALEPAAGILAGIADALEARRGHRQRAARLRELADAAVIPPDAAWRWAGEALFGQLRAAARLLARLGDATFDPAGDPVTETARRPGIGRTITATLSPLRVNAGLATEAGRHALRLAVIAGIGEVIAVGTGLPHGYWVVLTVAIILKPDYASTVYRGIQRAAGTVAGAGLGVATALLLHLGTAALVAGIGVTMTIAYAVIAVNYMMFAVFLTDFVVVLLVLLGEPAGTTALARLAGTGIGAALTLAGYLAWPTSAGGTAQQQFARLFQAQARYAAALLRAMAAPGAADRQALRSDQAAARKTRFDAEAITDRLADEPGVGPVTAKLALALTGTIRRFAHAALTLHAAVDNRQAGQKTRSARQPGTAEEPGPEAGGAGRRSAGAERRADDAERQGEGPGRHGGGTARPQAPSEEKAGALGRFADGLVTEAEVIARSLRTRTPPTGLPPLREMQKALGAGTADDVLLTATDEFTDALDTAADVLRRHLDEPGAPAR